MKDKNSAAVSILFLNKNKGCSSSPDQTLLKVALSNDVDIDHICGGSGSCGTCRVYIRSHEGELPVPTGVEKEMMENRDFKPGERLACQLLVKTSMSVQILSSHKSDLS